MPALWLSQTEAVRSPEVPGADPLDDLAEGPLVGGAEGVPMLAVDIQDQGHLTPPDQRDDDLGAGEGAAGDVTGELVHVRDEDRAALPSRSAANAAVERDPRAGDRPLERAE